MIKKFFYRKPAALTNSIQMQEGFSEGEGGNSKAGSVCPRNKSIAFEYFGLSRVRCAGYVDIEALRLRREQRGYAVGQ